LYNFFSNGFGDILAYKLLSMALITFFSLLILGWVTYTGLLDQKSTVENIFARRFQSYQTSATVARDISEVHAGLYKLISWTNAGYDKKKIEALIDSSVPSHAVPLPRRRK
jgi:phosphoglycerate-specific signal transduction histidine kinase